MNKPFPKLKTDKEIEALLNKSLSDYLHPNNFKPVTFEFKPKVKLYIDNSTGEQVTASSDKETYTIITSTSYTGTENLNIKIQKLDFEKYFTLV